MKTAVWLPLAALCLQGKEAPKFAICLLADRLKPAVSVFHTPDSAGQPIKFEESIRPLRGLALRLSQDAFQAGPGLVSFDATYRFRSGSASRHLVNGESDAYMFLPKDQIGYSYLALGGEWSFRRTLEGGLGAEARMEGLDRRREFSSMDPNLPAFVSENQSHQVRPWLRTHVAYNSAGIRLHPFLRVEAAWALTRRKMLDPLPMALGNDLRPFAPQFQIALAGGIRL